MNRERLLGWWHELTWFGRGCLVGALAAVPFAVYWGQVIVARVAVVDADVVQALLVHVPHGAGDTVLEGLGADHQDVGPAGGLGGHVLTAAEADLQPDLGRVWHERARVEGLLRDAQARQQAVHQGGLARFDRPRLDAAERTKKGRRIVHPPPL